MKLEDIHGQLLKDKSVIEEIDRHLWIESQKAGYSIGRDRAKEEWLNQYAMGWIKYHWPEMYAKLNGSKSRKK